MAWQQACRGRQQQGGPTQAPTVLAVLQPLPQVLIRCVALSASQVLVARQIVTDKAGAAAGSRR